MAIKKDNSFQLNGVTSNFCMKYSSDDLTRSVLGRIITRPTRDRTPPPACGNGFETENLPFAKGHVIALELGGSDEPYNVVPQFKYWQGLPNGKWRQMEKLIQETYNGFLMLVEIGYGRQGGIQSYDSMLKDYMENNLMEWIDQRIPDSFEVRIWNDSLDPSKITIDNDSFFDQTVTTLKIKKPVFECSFSLGTQMTEPDREMCIRQRAIAVANELLETHNSKKLKRQDSIRTFLLRSDTIEKIRTEMKKDKDLDEVEASGIQLCPLILDTWDATYPKIKRKWQQLAEDGLKVVSEVELEKPEKVKYFK